MKPNFYQFSATSLQGKEIDMKSYEGKTILVVSAASKMQRHLRLQWRTGKNCIKNTRQGLVHPDSHKRFVMEPDMKIFYIWDVWLIMALSLQDEVSKIDVNGPTAHPIYNTWKRNWRVFPVVKSNGISENFWLTKTEIYTNGFHPWPNQKNYEKILKNYWQNKSGNFINQVFYKNFQKDKWPTNN